MTLWRAEIEKTGLGGVEFGEGRHLARLGVGAVALHARLVEGDGVETYDGDDLVADEAVVILVPEGVGTLVLR